MTYWLSWEPSSAHVFSSSAQCVCNRRCSDCSCSCSCNRITRNRCRHLTFHALVSNVYMAVLCSDSNYATMLTCSSQATQFQHAATIATTTEHHNCDNSIFCLQRKTENVMEQIKALSHTLKVRHKTHKLATYIAKHPRQCNITEFFLWQTQKLKRQTVWLQAKVREHDGPVCDAQRWWGGRLEPLYKWTFTFIFTFTIHKLSQICCFVHSLNSIHMLNARS